MCIYAGGYAPRNAYVGLQLIPRHALRRRRNGMWLARISHIEEKTAAHEMANGCGTGSLVGLANLQMSQETREFILPYSADYGTAIEHLFARRCQTAAPRYL